MLDIPTATTSSYQLANLYRLLQGRRFRAIVNRIATSYQILPIARKTELRRFLQKHGALKRFSHDPFLAPARIFAEGLERSAGNSRRLGAEVLS